MIRFNCPKCEKHMKITAEHAGKFVRCVRCRLPMRAEAPQAGAGPTWLEAPAAARPNQSKAQVVFSRRRVLASAATIIILGAGVFFGLRTLLPSQLDLALKDLRSSDASKSKPALQLLSETDPQDAQRARVTAALETLLVSGDVYKSLDPDLVLRVYLAWAGKDNVPAMTRMVQNPTMPDWNSQKTAMVMDALAKLGDERAFAALAEKLADPGLRAQALNALRIAGPASQDAVLDMAFDGDPTTRSDAERLLAEFGASPKAIADAAFARLQSPQPDVERSAVGWFVENAPASDKQKAAGAALLSKLLINQQDDVCKDVLVALKAWATRDSLPDLVEYARREQKTKTGSPELLEVLAQFPDAAAAQAIALQLPNAGTRTQAGQALLKLGPVADDAVLAYINYPDAAVEKEARSVSRLLKIPEERALEQTLADVADARIARSREALHHLAQLRPDDASRGKVSQALNATLVDPSRGLSDESLRALLVWGSSENTETLLRMLVPFGSDDAARNARVIQFLGALRAASAAPVIAPGLEYDCDRGVVSSALRMIGAPAQDAVVPYLDSLSEATRVEAARILGEVGTGTSMAPLQRAYDDAGGDPLFSHELLAAMQRIAARN